VLEESLDISGKAQGGSLLTKNSGRAFLFHRIILLGWVVLGLTGGKGCYIITGSLFIEKDLWPAIEKKFVLVGLFG
jgi:hypothetical protein